MAGSEAYREMRRRADAAWRWLAAGSATALAGGVVAGLTARHLPLCFWLLRALATAQQAAVACWGLRLTTAACVGIACAVGLVLGRQWWRTAAAGALRFQTACAPAAVAEMAPPLGLNGRLLIATDERPWALTRGFLRPTVVLSRGLVDHLSGSELAAVLAHERHHVIRRDPLRLWVAQAACAAFLWLAPARRLLQAFALATELAADAFAMERVGQRPLASALHKLASVPRHVPTGLMTPALGLFGTAGGGLGPRVAQIAAFPQALPPAEHPWRLRGTGWAVLGCAAVWSLLAACAVSLLLR
jgi:Zn-dependent protease with chaperone function